ncbi:hypothetical protein [Brevibacillus laterosporus]|uniref:hypothetical protein n=1 Tax=Brevibacillus laterosporus TaxID=1465 RepID=UPI001EF2B43C|nr:hypothetical protein [Brevibacillus laterosporus]MCG7317913.1 hypothetical protein [Brevibacillus laterosporus]
MLSREQAIFFEVMSDLALDGYIEPLFLSYTDFIFNFNFSQATDMQVYHRAKECLKRYEHLLLTDDFCFYDMRWDILEKLDLEDADWENLD